MSRTRTIDRQVILRGRQVLAVTLAGLTLSAAAQSQPPAHRNPEVEAAGQAAFLRTDTDKDGLASRDEVDRRMPGIAARFDDFDMDRDDALNLKEFLIGYTTKE